MKKHTTRAWAYARGVVSGKIVAPELVKRQAALSLAWLKTKKYKFDEARAIRVCDFVESFPHTKGPKAASGEPLTLEDWQCFFICMPFGFVHADGTRVIKKVRLYVARKNGKSDLAARLALYMLTEDGEYAPEVYCGASTESQAWEVFRPALRMARKVEDFRAHYKVETLARSITVGTDDGFFKPIIGKPGDGASPSCAITDEYHEQDDDAQLTTMETGMGARAQPLSIVTSTAGETIGGPCYLDWLDCVSILNGVTENDELFALIYSADPDDDWLSDAALEKANPNIGVSVFRAFLISQRDAAIASARKQGPYKTKHLNLWVGAMDAYFNIVQWKKCADPEARIEDYEGCDAFVCSDLASKKDIASTHALIKVDDDTLITFGKYYVPQDGEWGSNNDRYKGYSAENPPQLIRTPGNVIDFEQIEEDILWLCKLLRVTAYGYDPFQGVYLAQRLQRGMPDLEILEFGQTVKNFSDPMKTLDADITTGKLQHDGNRCMEWMISNVVAYEDKKENVFPRKARDENKIDGPVSLIMCYGLLGTVEQEDESFWAAGT